MQSIPDAQTISGRQACNMAAYTSAIRYICEGDFDVIHNNALHPFLLSIAADLPTPMLAVLHTPVYKELAAAVQYASERNTTSRLAAVSVSESLAEEWTPFIDSDTVYNGIEVERWPFLQGEPTGDALWYGRIVPEKAPHFAIQAALKAGYAIEIAGPISDQTYFTNRIEPLIDGHTVRYLGHLRHSRIKQALSRARVFLNTSVWEEPYGFVYAEALASGTPVATFESGAAREILTEECGVIASDRTVEALSMAVAKAVNLSRAACRERAMTFCHIDTMIAGYEHRYQQLIRQQHLLNVQKKQDIVLPKKTAENVPKGVEQIQALVGIAT